MTTPRALAALLLASTLALTACGSDDEPDTAAAAPNSDTAAGSTAYAGPEVTANATDLEKQPVAAKGTGTAPTELQFKDLIVGKGDVAKAEDTVTVHYVGSLYTDGSVFDSSWKRGQPAQFSLLRVVKGFQQGIAGMKIGGRRIIVMPPDFGYGAQAIPGIPANSTLVFIVDLKSID